MRILCTCMPSLGHFHPMVAIARALQARGHEVAVATAVELHPEIRAAGFAAFAVGRDPTTTTEQRRTVMATELWPETAVPDLLARFEQWRPELVLHEEGDHAGPLAAAIAGIASIAHGWPAPVMSHERAERIARALEPRWRAWGRERPRTGGRYLDCCPPALQAAHLGELHTARPLRPIPCDTVADYPAWLDELRGPIAYITSGTVAAFNRLPGLFEIVLEGLRDEALEVVVTIGHDNDPSALAARFPRAHIARYIPQSLVLARCHVAIGHGGASSTTAALAHGLPVVVLPRGAASQQRMGDACAAAGVGRVLGAHEASPATVRAAVRTVLDDAGYRERAEATARAIAALPAPDVLAAELAR